MLIVDTNLTEQDELGPWLYGVPLWWADNHHFMIYYIKQEDFKIMNELWKPTSTASHTYVMRRYDRVNL